MRQNFATVAEQAKYVTINYDCLNEYADSLRVIPESELLDDSHHFTSASDEDTAAYITILDTINFGSGFKPFLLQEGYAFIENSIYYTLSTKLKTIFERNPLTAQKLADLSLEDVAGLFTLDLAKPYSRELADLFHRALCEMGGFIQFRHQGSFMNWVNSAQGSVETLVSTLVALESFDDTHNHKGLSVSFHKRAQITAADLHIAFRKKGETLFNDISKLTMFADNAVAHVLRTDGVLTYTPALAAQIDGGQPLPSGSEVEIEIRACEAHVVELIAARKNICSMECDHILWHRSANPIYKAHPTHRTLSWFY